MIHQLLISLREYTSLKLKLCAISFLYFCFSSISNAQTKDIIPLSDYTLPASAEKVFYLTGEYHGVSSNPKVEAHFYRELIQKQNVRTIIMERSAGNAYLINKYLNTGDTIYLNLYTSRHPNCYKEEKEKIITLKTLNDALMPDDKITVFGADVTEDDRLPYARNFFDALIKAEIKNTELKQQLDSLLQSDSFPNNINEIKKTLQRFNNPSDFTTEIDDVVNSYLIWQQIFKVNFLKGRKSMRNREQYLYQNVLKNQPLYKGNIYANFGSAHLNTNPFPIAFPIAILKKLAYYLKSDASFKYSIITYLPFYYNCKNYREKTVNSKPSLERNIKEANLYLSTGIYFTQQKKKRYIIHVNQPAMTKIK